MQRIVNLLPKNLNRSKILKSDAEWLQMEIDRFNDTEGEEKDFQCNICKNKGAIAVEQDGEMVIQICDCMKARRSIRAMRNLGINPNYTFKNWDQTEGWQQHIYQQAQQYLQSGKGWFFVGGQIGSGKSHICTAIIRRLILQRLGCIYMMWPDASRELKAAVNDVEKYQQLIKPLQEVDVLYIDDFLKTADGNKPTPADIKLAYMILNARYNANKRTLISSEYNMVELLNIDEAVGSRIGEMAKNKVNVKKDISRNYRLKKCGMII